MSADNFYAVDTDANIITVTLPASPTTGDTIRIADKEGNARNKNITIARNGNTIDEVALDLILDVDFSSVDLRWDGTDWEIVNLSSSGNALLAGNGLTSNASHYAVLANTGIVANSTGTYLNTTGAYTWSSKQTLNGGARLNDNDILEFGSSADAEMFFNATNLYLDLNLGDFIIRDGTTTRFTFDDTGAFTATGDVTANSDEKLKTNIETLDGNKVFDMRGVSFNWIETGLPSSGVIAQELEAIAPELVLTHKDGTKSVAYGKTVGYLIEAIKILRTEIEHLKDQNK